MTTYHNSTQDGEVVHKFVFRRDDIINAKTHLADNTSYIRLDDLRLDIYSIKDRLRQGKMSISDVCSELDLMVEKYRR